MADQEELGLPVPELETLSDDLSSEQTDAIACTAIPSDEIKKKKTRRAKRGKSKKIVDGINCSSSSANTADNFFSLITASQIDGAFARMCIDLQTGELTPEFAAAGNMGSCDGGLSLDPGGKKVRKRQRSKIKSYKSVNENTVPQEMAPGLGIPGNDGAPAHKDLNASRPPNFGKPILGNTFSTSLCQDLVGNSSGEMSQGTSSLPIDLSKPTRSAGTVTASPSGKIVVQGLSPHTPQCSVISASIDAANSTPKSKNRRKKPGSSQKNVSTPNASASNGTPRANGKRTSGMNVKRELFSDYVPEAIVELGLKGKQFIEGTIRINPKSYTEAYIADPEKGQDILIEGIKNRNRALEGDTVVVYVHPPQEWKKQPNQELQKTATVVFLRTCIHPRVAVGLLKPMPDRQCADALFSPRDARVPRIRIPAAGCPAGFLTDPRQFDKTLFLASITDWPDTRHAVGSLLTEVGPLGDLAAENTAILVENDLRTDPYPAHMHAHFPDAATYTVSEAEACGREDLRTVVCLFTIDPATARDLDDAVSVRDLGGGRVEVGVHISDVSHYVKEGTPFDTEVADRATSVYMVDTVYHMLPRELCNLCSLLPGQDKLAYSVFWEMDADGNVLGHRFVRSVVNSCVQLSYEHAQVMVEHPDKVWRDDELPQIHGGYTARQLSATVNHLHRLAVVLRGRRFADGALRIDQPKLNFSLDPDTRRPVSYTCYVNKESHRLIEEFMLLANMTVAEHIYTAFPRLAFLRSHLPPHTHLMDRLRTDMEQYGVHLDVSSAGALQRTMSNYAGEDFPSRARMMVLYARCSKPMARARYFCTNGIDKEDFAHYALNVPLYTHFTSPIRRYPDIMVHRLLSASLQYCDPPDWVPDQVQRIASNCNQKKFSAKRAGEQSVEIYLSLYVEQLGEVVESAVVIDVKDRSFDVIVCCMGINQRIYTNNLSKAEVKHVRRDNASVLEITWLPSAAVPCAVAQTIEMFSIVSVRVTKTPGVLKVQSELIPPPAPGSIPQVV